MARPSIAELEAILQREDEVEIEILPSGEVRAKNETTSAERGKPASTDRTALWERVAFRVSGSVGWLFFFGRYLKRRKSLTDCCDS